MAYFDLDYDDYDEYGYFDVDEEDWWDEYTYYRDEEDAYWSMYYSKVVYNLPDSHFITDVSLRKEYLHPSSVEDVISYEKLFSIIAKIEKLFNLWQRRLSHEWNKDVKNPLHLCNGNDKDKTDCATTEGSTGKGDKNKDESNPVPAVCPHFLEAVQVLEEYGIMHNIFSPMLSDDEDVYDMFGHYDSDEWDSSLDDMYFPAGKAGKSGKESNDAKLRYQKSAEKFYAAFPKEEDAKAVLNDLTSMKNWISSLLISSLVRNTGRLLPHLVMEKIFEMLLNKYGEPQMKMGSIAKTKRFVDVENLRRKELYLAFLEIHMILFEILFKNQNISNTLYLKEVVRKLFQTALHRFTMLEELVSWLQCDYVSGPETPNGFMSGRYYCKALKGSSKDFDYLHTFNDSCSSLNGQHLAVLLRGVSKEGLMKIYDVSTFECVKRHCIDRDDVALSVALLDDHFALLLKKNACCCIELHTSHSNSYRKPSVVELGASCINGPKRLLLTKFEKERKLLVQKEDDVIIVDINNDGDDTIMTVEETFRLMELLGVKERYLFVRQSVKDVGYFNIASSAKVDTSIKVFDLKSSALLTLIPNPDKDNTLYPKKWSLAIDSAPGSLKFAIWIGERVQLWDLEGKIEKKKEFGLGKRLNNGTKCVLHGDILAVQSMQNSVDSSYDSVQLTEILFYDLNSEDICYHETYDNVWERPQCHISISSGRVYGLLMGDNVLVSLHFAGNGGEMRICNFGLSQEKIISLQVVELMEKRREEEVKRQLKEAERKRQNEERMRRKEEQRLKRLEKKRKQREAQQKKKQQADTLRNIANTGAFVIGEITEWRITYGFLRINGIGDAFIHISDILGRPHISPGCRIRCKLQDQLGHPRPKAVQASLF